MRGVVEAVEGEESEEAQAALFHALIAGLASALDALVVARAAEGLRLERVIEKQLATIGSLVERAAKAQANQPAAIAARLGEQIAPPDRGCVDARSREAASGGSVACRQGRHPGGARPSSRACRRRQRADRQDQPGGRKFEFLAQEFNREANTLCSKASDIEISRTGLELKTVIDQLREQVQNIE